MKGSIEEMKVLTGTQDSIAKTKTQEALAALVAAKAALVRNPSSADAV